MADPNVPYVKQGKIIIVPAMVKPTGEVCIQRRRKPRKIYVIYFAERLSHIPRKGARNKNMVHILLIQIAQTTPVRPILFIF